MKTIEVSDEVYNNIQIVAKLEKKTINEFLENISRKHIEPKNFESILFLISFYTSIPYSAITSKSRKSELVFCRMVFWEYCKFYNLGSNFEIKNFIKIDRSTFQTFIKKNDRKYINFKKNNNL